MEKGESKNNELVGLEDKENSSPKFKILGLIFIFVVVGFVFYQFQGPLKEEDTAGVLDLLFSKTLEVGDLAPDFITEDIFGDKVSLNSLRGESPLLLVFWATWCGYCAKELPDLKAFTEEYQDEIEVLAVASGESKTVIGSYIQEEAVNFLMVLDEDRKIWNQYFVRGTPSHFLISSSGEIIALRPGLASKGDLEMMLTMLPIEP